MNDPVWFLKGVVLPAAVAAILVGVAAWPWRQPKAVRVRAGWIIGICLAGFIGEWALNGFPDSVLANSNVRYAILLMPAAAVAWLITSLSGKARWVGVALIVAVIAGAMPVLLYKSIYISNIAGPDSREWSTAEVIGWMTLVPLVMLISISGTTTLIHRHHGRIWPWVIGTVLWFTGLMNAFNGSESIGQLAMSGSGAVLGVAVLAIFLRRSVSESFVAGPAILMLAALVICGRFFGTLATWQAVALLAAPLLGWIAAVPVIKRRRKWVQAVIILFVTLAPLAAATIHSAIRFAQEYDEKYSY